MPQLRLLSLYFLSLLAIYVALVALWSVVDGAYLPALRAVETEVFSSYFQPEGHVEFLPYAGKKPGLDLEILLGTRKSRALNQMIAVPVRGLNRCYAPMCLLISLVLVSPVPWRRRSMALLMALVLFHVWLTFGFSWAIVDKFSNDDVFALYSFSPFVKKAVSFVSMTLTQSTFTQFVVPVFIWVLVTFRRGDWGRLVGVSQSTTSQIRKNN